SISAPPEAGIGDWRAVSLEPFGRPGELLCADPANQQSLRASRGSKSLFQTEIFPGRVARVTSPPPQVFRVSTWYELSPKPAAGVQEIVLLPNRRKRALTRRFSPAQTNALPAAALRSNEPRDPSLVCLVAGQVQSALAVES